FVHDGAADCCRAAICDLEGMARARTDADAYRRREWLVRDRDSLLQLQHDDQLAVFPDGLAGAGADGRRFLFPNSKAKVWIRSMGIRISACRHCADRHPARNSDSAK